MLVALYLVVRSLNQYIFVDILAAGTQLGYVAMWTAVKMNVSNDERWKLQPPTLLQAPVQKIQVKWYLNIYISIYFIKYSFRTTHEYVRTFYKHEYVCT